MLSQDYLNSISLEEASGVISRALIDERISLRDQKVELEKLRAQYQNDYIVANDGDASENAPLEQAIQNLKTITGDIVSVLKKSQSLDKIEDSLYVTEVYDFDLLLTDISAMGQDSIRVLLSIFGAGSVSDVPGCIKAIGPDDFVSKVQEFDQYYGQTMANIIRDEYPEGHEIWKTRSALMEVVDEKLKDGTLAHEYKVLSDFEPIKKMKMVRPYNYCGIVVLYTTVRLDLNGRKFTYKIYPRGLSFIDDGVMAADSRLATALMGRRAGDTVGIRSVSGGKILNYKIVDIY